MGTAETSSEIIILSDDEDGKENDESCLIVEVENVKKSDTVLTANLKDEDLVVTFSRSADVLPHARYDCPVHLFTATECEVDSPVANNQLFCEQCFCYICDKLASKCEMWCHSGKCHCNSHKKSNFWNTLRNSTLLGQLNNFNLTLTEVDSHLRQADSMLQSFRQELSEIFSSIMCQLMKQGNEPNQQHLVFDLLHGLEFVTSFLDRADKQNSRAAAILNLGAAEEFVRQCQKYGLLVSYPSSKASQAIMLLHRIIASVQRLMVMANFTPDFILKLQNFYQNRVCLPPEIRGLKNRLCVRPWDDILLVTVLKGQNMSGVRKDKGKKDVLFEEISVVLLRTELLQRQCRYKELTRYLRIVQTNDSTVLQQVQDLIPYFSCQLGDFPSAVLNLFPVVNAPATRFTPQLFLIYLRIFETATAPKLLVSRAEQLCFSQASWLPIKDAVPLKRPELVRFALKAQRFSAAVYTDSQIWTSLLRIVNSHSNLFEPSQQFLNDARSTVTSLLLDQHNLNLHIPRSFLEVYPDQALLLLVTGALAFRILQGPLTPVLPVLNCFRDNSWAYRWLCDSLSTSTERLNSFMQELAQEVEKTTGSALDLASLQPCSLHQTQP